MAAVQTGEISHETIQQAVERVLRLKSARLSWDDLPAATALSWSGGAEHRQLRDYAYELSTTLVRNDDSLVPLHLKPDERIVVLSSARDMRTQAEDRHYAIASFVEEIRQYHQNVERLTIPANMLEQQAYERVLAATKETDLLLIVTMNAHRDAEQAALVRSLLQSGRRVIGLAVGIPYDLLAFPQLRTYLVTYEATDPALAAAAKVLFGLIEPKGHLPVSLPVERAG